MRERGPRLGFGSRGLARPIPYRYALGGPFQLSAFQVGEYRATDYAIGRGYLLKKLWQPPPPAGQGLYAILGLEGGGLFNPQSLAVRPLSVMGGFAFSTPLGTLSVGGAHGSAGREKLFITCGRLF